MGLAALVTILFFMGLVMMMSDQGGDKSKKSKFSMQEWLKRDKHSAPSGIRRASTQMRAAASLTEVAVVTTYTAGSSAIPAVLPDANLEPLASDEGPTVGATNAAIVAHDRVEEVKRARLDHGEQQGHAAADGPENGAQVEGAVSNNVSCVLQDNKTECPPRPPGPCDAEAVGDHMRSKCSDGK